MSDLVGQQLGNYRLLRVLGQGSFATVYLGEQPGSRSPGQVAIKVFHKPISSQEGELLRKDEALLTHLPPGQALLTTYLVPFEVASVLLLLVMLGAAYLARAERR